MSKLYFLYKGVVEITFFEQKKKIVKGKKTAKLKLFRRKNLDYFNTVRVRFGENEIVGEFEIPRREKTRRTSAKVLTEKLEYFEVSTRILFNLHPMSRFKIIEKIKNSENFFKKNKASGEEESGGRSPKEAKGGKIRKMKLNIFSKTKTKQLRKKIMEMNQGNINSVVGKAKPNEFLNEGGLVNFNELDNYNKEELRRLAMLKSISMDNKVFKELIQGTFGESLIEIKSKKASPSKKKKYKINDFFEFQDGLREEHLKRKADAFRQRRNNPKAVDYLRLERPRSIFNKLNKLPTLKFEPLSKEKREIKERSVKEIIDRFSRRKFRASTDYEFINKQVLNLDASAMTDRSSANRQNLRGSVTNRERSINSFSVVNIPPATFMRSSRNSSLNSSVAQAPRGNQMDEVRLPSLNQMFGLRKGYKACYTER